MNGFILIELKNAEDAKEVISKWDGANFFNPDKLEEKTHACLLEDATAKAVIKDVDKNLTDREMTTDLRKHFPGAAAKRLRYNGGPSYSVMLTFT